MHYYKLYKKYPRTHAPNIQARTRTHAPNTHTPTQARTHLYNAHGNDIYHPFFKPFHFISNWSMDRDGGGGSVGEIMPKN